MGVFDMGWVIDDGLVTTQTLSGWWFGTFFIVPNIGNVIIPTDEVIFFRGLGSTTNQLWIVNKCPNCSGLGMNWMGLFNPPKGANQT
jgi:hypothetical protein